MKDKKAVILIVLAVAAIISLLYGIITSFKGRSRGEGKKALLTGEVRPQITFAARRAKRSIYKSWGRDPFSLPGASVKKFKGFILNGILWDKENPMAIINNRIVKAGDSISGSVVIGIKEDRVVLTDGATEFDLILK